MKNPLLKKTLLFVCYSMLATLPWSSWSCSVADHVDPNQLVTCSCTVRDNSGTAVGTDTRQMNCPSGRFTCTCNPIRGNIDVFTCN